MSTHVIDHVATVNMRVTIPSFAASTALTKVLTHPAGGVDLVGLQEWGNSRNEILRRNGSLHRTPRLMRALGRSAAWQRKDGYVWARALLGGSPVGAAGARYELIKVWTRVLALPGRVDKSLRRRSWLPASLATVALFFDHVLGEEVVVVNYHLTAEVQIGRHYRGDRPMRVARHKGEVRGLGRIAHHQLKKGRRVYFVGDGNFDGLQIPGLVSCWTGHERHAHTLGHRAVDIIHAQDEATQVDVIESISDHDHPIATYPRGASR